MIDLPGADSIPCAFVPNQPNKQAARQKVARQARAAAARRRRRTRQRIIAGVVASALILGLVVAVFVSGSSSSKNVNTASATSSTEPENTAPSAAGKPCVAVADPLPPGAPAVPVKVGPPPDKLVTEDLKVGNGAVVTSSQSLTVNYIGVSCSTGKIFDSSYKSGQPATFTLAQVIPGWQQGIPGMRVGGQRLLGIPPSMGYGPQGSPPDIAPNETLWFVVDIVDAK